MKASSRPYCHCCDVRQFHHLFIPKSVRRVRDAQVPMAGVCTRHADSDLHAKLLSPTVIARTSWVEKECSYFSPNSLILYNFVLFFSMPSIIVPISWSCLWKFYMVRNFISVLQMGLDTLKEAFRHLEWIQFHHLQLYDIVFKGHVWYHRFQSVEGAYSWMLYIPFTMYASSLLGCPNVCQIFTVKEEAAYIFYGIFSSFVPLLFLSLPELPLS